MPDVERFAAHHGYDVAQTYTVSESAWNGGKDGGEYRRTLKQALDDAHPGKFSVLIVWALDRITREGAEGALRIIRQFRERGCTVVSVKESWLNGSPEIQDVLVAFAGWMAQQESARRSERIRAGLERRRAEGQAVGRQPGAADRKPRRRLRLRRGVGGRRQAQSGSTRGPGRERALSDARPLPQSPDRPARPADFTRSSGILRPCAQSHQDTCVLSARCPT